MTMSVNLMATFVAGPARALATCFDCTLHHTRVFAADKRGLTPSAEQGGPKARHAPCRRRVCRAARAGYSFSQGGLKR